MNLFQLSLCTWAGATVSNVNTGILETVMLEKASDAFLSKLQL